MSEDSISRELEEGMRQLGLYTSTDDFADYLALLYKWNQAYNLTAIRDKHTMVSRHILDSLAILPWLKGRRILDVGTGAGLPGIPLALIRPDLEVVLVDSQGKKIRFLQEVKRQLGIKNIHIEQTRIENYHPDHAFDTVVSRAFSELTPFIQLTQHVLAPDGIWLAMKGRVPEAELATLSFRHRVEPYRVPGLEGDRCCIIIYKE